MALTSGSLVATVQACSYGLQAASGLLLVEALSDGRPHVTPLPAIWLDGSLHFCAGAHEQKAKNLESNPRCILTTGTNQLRSGLDVVVEGAAARVTGKAQLRRLAAMWKSKLDWDFDVTGEVLGDARGRQRLVFGV